MASQFCTHKLEGLEQMLLLSHGTPATALCIFHFIFSLVDTLGNLLVIRALWKASSISATMKKLFPSLAFSDLAMGLFAQLMSGVIIGVSLKMPASKNYHGLDFHCPTTGAYLPISQVSTGLQDFI